MFTLITNEIIDQIEAFCLNCIIEKKTKREKRCVQVYEVAYLDQYKYRKDGHEFDSFHYWDFMKTELGTAKTLLKSYLWDNYLIQFFRYQYGENLRLPLWEEKIKFLRAIVNEDESSHKLEMPWCERYLDASLLAVSENMNFDEINQYHEDINSRFRRFHDYDPEYHRKDILSEIKKLTPAIKQARERLKIYRELTTPQPKSTDVAIGGFTPPPQPRDDDVCLGNASKHLKPLDNVILANKFYQ